MRHAHETQMRSYRSRRASTNGRRAAANAPRTARTVVAAAVTRSSTTCSYARQVTPAPVANGARSRTGRRPRCADPAGRHTRHRPGPRRACGRARRHARGPALRPAGNHPSTTRPSSRRTTRSARAASASLCVAITSAPPARLCSAKISRICCAGGVGHGDLYAIELAEEAHVGALIGARPAFRGRGVGDEDLVVGNVARRTGLGCEGLLRRARRRRR